MRNDSLGISTVFAAGLLAGILGCSGSDDPKLIPAGGVVNYQGRPLPGAKVTFIPESKGGVAMATTDSQGKFTLKTGMDSGIAAGPCSVTVTMMEASSESGLSNKMTPEDMQMLAMQGKLEAELAKQEKSLIPKKYAKADSSGLNFEVKSGSENQFTINLED